MEKHKRWQSLLIIGVVLLTIYNILPTVFFYTKPLNKPVDEKTATNVATAALERVNQLEQGSKEWLESYCNLLHIKPDSISVDPSTPQILEVTFKKREHADVLTQYLPRAGNLIPFYPSQLSVYHRDIAPTDEGFIEEENSEHKVYVLRKIPLRFNMKSSGEFFTFAPKFAANNEPTAAYRDLIQDRLGQVVYSVAGPSENGQLTALALDNLAGPRGSDFLLKIAENIQSYQKAFGIDSPITKRFYKTFSQSLHQHAPQETINSLTQAIETLKDRVHTEKVALKSEQEAKQQKQEFLEPFQKERLSALTRHEETLLSALTALKSHRSSFINKQSTLTLHAISSIIEKAEQKNGMQVIELGSYNPIVKAIHLDWGDQSFFLELHKDIVQKKNGDALSSRERDAISQLIYDEIAKISRESSEELKPHHSGYQIALNILPDSTSFLQFNLSEIANAQMHHIKNLIKESWNPETKDLQKGQYPLLAWSDFSTLPKNEQHLSLVLYSPSTAKGETPAGFRTNSIYVIAKDLLKIAKKFESAPNSPQAKQFFKDFQKLEKIMQTNGFLGYAGTTYPLSSAFANDFIFEAEDYYLPVLQATRENFSVHGTKQFAVLELSNIRQRILTTNRIETAMHEDLLKWKDEYNSAQVDPTERMRFDVPKPTTNVLWSNLGLSAKKYFRGDERKILQWGLDMSGGKTVQVQLRDANNRPVTDEADIKQGMNELYNRVNKMGVSEVSIRQEGNAITIDFPGSQSLSAADLVKASSMTFHVMNEKFSIDSQQPLAETTNRFLQEIWNEAVVTNKKDSESIATIAWSHLYGDSMDPENVQPRSESARILYENGLRLSDPNDPAMSSSLNDTISKIAILQGNSFTEWSGQTHPLVVVFNNYALEGSSLENVHANYDPTKGNFLSFDVKSSQSLSSGEKINPRNELHTWTSLFSKENIVGTPYESYTKGRGWRMAVILNGKIVSAPTLDSPLSNSAMISGHFTQREVNRLVADLKAGSLTFTPQILSEKNVSPDLGIKERYQGIAATIIALIAVIAVMIGYYRFAGLVASIAVLFNLLIMWATLQNIGAAITLAGIAGIILTVGMAVDANVLVFERVREEFAKTGKLALAVAAGYKKAYSAILDSNITTIIAALILLHFDSGPIKGFAVTLIIGIVSSMFTALFMTRYFFSRWVQNPKHTKLTMMNLIRGRNFNFLKWGRFSIALSALVIVVGAFFFTKNLNTILGMDFTGGFTTTIELQTAKDGHYRESVEKALINAGASQQDIQIRELSPNNQLRIFLSKNMNLVDKPFYGMPVELSLENPQYSYETNPRLVWLVNALEQNNLSLTEKSLSQVDQNWKNISGQMSDTMRNNAVIGLVIALLCILAYITIRFEFTFAISATIGLAFDVLITLALLAIFHSAGIPIQIDLNTVAALMTIVGYSLNDTIIVFDRVREDMRVMKKNSFKEIINHALNITLSRTIMTSFTTLLVLIALVIFGGSSIFGFSLIMAIGVVVGTLSTFFLAASLLLFFQRKESSEENIVLNGTH